MAKHTIGVDVSKDTLDVHRLPSGEKRRFANDPDGHRALLDWMGDDIDRVVFEPTGRYHRSLERCLSDAGLRGGRGISDQLLEWIVLREGRSRYGQANEIYG